MHTGLGETMKLATFISIAGLSSLTFAQESDQPEVRLPDVHIGDKWTYSVLDLRKNASLPERSYTVLKIDAGGIETAVVGSPRPTQAFERDWSGRNYIKSYSFPLSVGKTWHTRPAFNNPECDATEADIDVKVVGWQDVTVPAGTFHALKIELDGTWTAAKCGTGKVSLAFWYVPEVRRHVQYEEAWYNPRGQLNNGVRFQLQSFALQ